MKANEISEKLYISYMEYGCFNDDGSITRTNESQTEYIRTDAFIEKVVNFLEMLGYGFTITDNITHTNYNKEQLVEDFKNYVKGE